LSYACTIGSVMALFAMLPYGKFAQGIYRNAGAAEVGDRVVPAEQVSARRGLRGGGDVEIVDYH
jgi:hypothetical protein